MGFIAEFEISSPILQQTCEAVQDMTLETLDVQTQESGPTKYMFWAWGGDYETFEAELSRDPTITDFMLLYKQSDRKLYRVTISEDANKGLVYPKAAEFDIVYMQCTKNAGETFIRAEMPTRDAFRMYQQACEANDKPINLLKLYQNSGDGHSNRHGLTDKQREAVVEAYEAGYFGESREADLEEIASTINISRQALAGRIRRAEERIIEDTLM
jgi:predicted DNA binding protein